MRFAAFQSLALLTTVGTFACANGAATFGPDDGGAPGSGGSANTQKGGSPASGGAQGAGGNMSVMNGGALTSSAGNMSVMSGGGGATSSGGATSGGQNAQAGNSAQAGKANQGGTTGQGGNAMAGATNRGGTSGAAGGNMARGGTGNGGAGNSGAGNGGNMARGGTGNGGSGMGGVTGSGGSNVTQPPPITGGSNGWASRYWDCCKPACGWKGNVHTGNPMTSCSQSNQNLSSYDTKNACESGGSAYMCWNASPWSVSSTLSYGFAAASVGNYVCGRCYQVQFTGSGHSGTNAGATSLNGKTMIIQVINNGGVAADQFDLLIPGGGVGALNACSTQWGTSDLGSQYGGFLAGCNGDKNCVQQKCQSVFSGKPDLQAGCDWFLNWFNAADNPNFVFKQVACPSAITQKSGLSDPG